MGDVCLEALQVPASEVHVLLDPLLHGSGGLLVGCHQTIELLSNSIVMGDEIVQPMLNITPIFIQAPCHDLPEREAMGGRNQEGLQGGIPDNAKTGPMSQKPPHPL